MDSHDDSPLFQLVDGMPRIELDLGRGEAGLDLLDLAGAEQVAGMRLGEADDFLAGHHQVRQRGGERHAFGEGCAGLAAVAVGGQLGMNHPGAGRVFPDGSGLGAHALSHREDEARPEGPIATFRTAKGASAQAGPEARAPRLRRRRRRGG